MRRPFKAAVVLALAALAFEERSPGTQIVHDPASLVVHTAQNTLNYVQHLTTQINTYLGYKQMLLQVAHMGNVQEVANLVGLSDVGDLISSGQQLYADYRGYSSLLDPRSFQSDAQSILSGYRLQSWQGYLAANGSWVSPNPGNYQFATTSFNTSKKTVDILEGLQKQRERLEKDLQGLQGRVRSAATHAEALKLLGQVEVVKGELSDVDNKIHATAERAHLQQVQTDAAEKIYRATQLDRQDAVERQGVDHELEALPASLYGQTIDW